MENSGCPTFLSPILSTDKLGGKIPTVWKVQIFKKESSLSRLILGWGFGSSDMFETTTEIADSIVLEHMPPYSLPSTSTDLSQTSHRSGSWFPLLHPGKQGHIKSMVETIMEERRSSSATEKGDTLNCKRSKSKVILGNQVE